MARVTVMAACRTARSTGQRRLLSSADGNEIATEPMTTPAEERTGEARHERPS